MQVTTEPVRTTVPMAAPSDAAKASLNYDSFLKLLIATMKNQDPTKPNDPSQTMSQLASFSGVEQSIKTNAKLDTLLAVAASGQAGSLIGKTIASDDGQLGGVVRAVSITQDGLVATLEDGRSMAVGPGVTISGA